MAQYRGSAKSRGYNPRRVDQSNIQRMREDSERTARAMREAAEMEITDRRRVSRQVREDQADTRRMQQKNFDILTGNLQRELSGLQAQATRDQQQYAVDSKAVNTILGSIANFSSTASELFLKQEQEKKTEEQRKEWYGALLGAKRDEEEGNGKSDALLAQNAAVNGSRVNALNKAEATGGADLLVTSELEVSEPSQQVSLGLAEANAKVEAGGFTYEAEQTIIERQNGLPDGEVLTFNDIKEIIDDSFNVNVRGFFEENWPPELAERTLRKLADAKISLIKKYREKQTTFNNNQILSQTLSTFTKADDKQKIIEFPVTWTKLLRQAKGDNRVAWELLKPQVTAIDERTGEPVINPDVLRQLPLVIFDKKTTVGEHFTNANGQEVGILREFTSELMKNRRGWERRRSEARAASQKEVEQQLLQALNPETATAANYDEAQAMHVQMFNEESPAIAARKKHLAVPLAQNQSFIQSILSKDDLELTKADEDAVKIASSEGEAYQIIKQRRESPTGPAQFESTAIQKRIRPGLGAIRGNIDFSKAALPGSGIAEIYYTQQVYQRALDLMGDPSQPTGYTLEEAVATAVAEETAKHEEQRDTKNYSLPYARKILPGGLVSYPHLEKLAGNIAPGDIITNQRLALKRRIIDQAATGDDQAFGTIVDEAESIISPKRMEYLIKNPDAPPSRLESAALSYSNGMSLHEMRNRQYRALGGTEDIFRAPAILGNVKVSADLQRIFNDPGNSVHTKLNAVNIAAGNTDVYKSPVFMRAGSPMHIYTSGNIGPTSTGPHLDVKRVDGQEFAPSALDTFIEVEDPELGRVPLSKVPITGDFAEHKARGSHGIDYGLYSGTQVFVKNGAKVVDTKPSEHGDVVTIELPNGLRYTFLHGTAPK